MSRRLVVVLFLDLVGWTRLAEQVDPEPLQLMLEQYYEICSVAVEEHGGSVEKFIGDAVMAVFGAVRSEEDDALRALRTAIRIRADVATLPGPRGAAPSIHCGVAAGEALVTNSSRAGLRVVGDVVNLAARLQSAAAADEIVVNETVAHLARRHFALAVLAPLVLKGKAEPVPAFLVLGPAPDTDPDDESPMVDRADERARLRAAYARVVAGGRAEAIAIVGPGGIGKSRLVREVVKDLTDDPDGRPAPTVVVGECPSYGPMDTYLPLVRVLDALIRESPHTEARLARVLEDLRTSAPGVEEIAWAAREVLAAATAPLIVVWDGLESAGLSLLRLIGELVGTLRHLPLLMICVGRPEWAEVEPACSPAMCDDVIDLGALTPADSATLTALLSAGSVDVLAHAVGSLERVVSHSAGNPLFIRLMVESSPPDLAVTGVPATITAMVGAMLDRLPAAARQLLGAASVIGLTFTVDELVLLGQPVPDRALEPLVARQLIRPAARTGEYTFVQQPVHETAYTRLDKECRLGWHRALADASVSPAFHLNAAVRLLGDLRPHDDELARLRRLAASASLLEGTTALRQRDIPAAVGLLGQALSSDSDGTGAATALRLSDALLLDGATARALKVVAEVGRRSADPRTRRACLMQERLLAVRLGDAEDESVPEELAGDPDDHLAWCRFEQLRVLVNLRHGRFGAAERAARTALAHARLGHDSYEEDRLLVALCEVRQWAPTPLREQLAGCADLAGRFAGDRVLLVPVLAAQARCLALLGDARAARSTLTAAGTAVEQLRLTIGGVLVDQAWGLAHALEGEHGDAERCYRRAADGAHRAGHAPTALTLRVQAARERLRHDPTPAAVADLAELAARSAGMDIRGRLLSLSATVAAAAARGTYDPRTEEVMTLLEGTDDPCLRAEVHFDLARSYRSLGDDARARASARTAIDCYTLVGAVRPEGAVRAWM
ncbi:adenylate/guanylate cyclase domain-containing protein [Actinoplanes sp. NPDC051346]|uniref:adenylate/guanylate cyclase domain-containing protein n=1 Tax=Actinoplanes sp. NPDC051346 TaxID=3155048 RepID=UPI003412BF8D